MFEAAVQGFLNLLSINVVLATLAGVAVGTFTAVTPQGLGTPLMYALFLPVVIKWDPFVAIAFLIGMDAVSSICSAYLPILFGIPGGAGSQSTVMDGYPMGRNGEARRALGASFMAGMLGSLIGTVTLAFAIPIAKPIIYMMGSPELFVVVLWGLTMVALLAGTRPMRGLIAAAVGLLIAVVGMQPQSGVFRFVFFDEPYLLDGLPITIVALAMFGVPAALDLALTRVGVEQEAVPLKGRLLDGVKDTFREWWLVVRCSFMGVWVGIIPGLGAQVVDWLSYGHAAQTCKGAKDTFGKGDVRGVIAPESANDSKDGGTLIPTLILGVPGSLTSALFIFALLAMGFVPGPQMVKEHADVIYSIVWILGIGGVLGTSIGFLFANQLAKLAELRYSLIVPMILAFVLMGALSATRHPLDMLTVVSIGVLGYFMKRVGYPRPPLILGMILGSLVEKYLYISTAAYGFAWLGRPGVIILMVLVFGTLFYTVWSRREMKARPVDDSSGSSKWTVRFRPESILTIFFIAVFVGAIIRSLDWPLIARLMPIYVAAIPGLFLALAQLGRDVIVREQGVAMAAGGIEMDEVFNESLDRGVEVKRTLAFFSWFAGGAVGVWLLGIVIALPLFILLYMLIEGKEKLWMSILYGAGAYLMVWGLFEGLFKIIWPEGLLFS